jgi:hypothetical protein
MSKFASISSNKLVLALGAGVVATGAVAASAATLGTLTPQSLGTSTAAVSGCQNGSLTVSWTAPTYGSNSYTTTGATLGGINPTCNSKSYKMTVANTGGTSLAEVTGNTGTGGSVAGSFAAIDTAAVGNVTVTIYG